MFTFDLEQILPTRLISRIFVCLFVWRVTREQACAFSAHATRGTSYGHRALDISIMMFYNPTKCIYSRELWDSTCDHLLHSWHYFLHHVPSGLVIQFVCLSSFTIHQRSRHLHQTQYHFANSIFVCVPHIHAEQSSR